MTNQETIKELKIIRNVYANMRKEYRSCVEALDVAISALQAQKQHNFSQQNDGFSQCLVNGDLISRQAAIETLDKRFDSVPMEQTTEILMLRKDLRELPSAEPEPRWIPVSERLPESKPEDLEYPTVIACCEDGEVMTACYYESTKEWGTGENYDKKINPVAWMPLPEPYRAERRTDESDK